MSNAPFRMGRMAGSGPLKYPRALRMLGFGGGKMRKGGDSGRSSASERYEVANGGLSHEEQSSLRQLLEKDPDLALHAAIKDGDPVVVRDLLQSGADPDAVVTAREGDSQVVAAALHTAVGEGNLEIVRMLLDAGAEPNVSTDGVKGTCRMAGTALHVAVSR